MEEFRFFTDIPCIFADNFNLIVLTLEEILLRISQSTVVEAVAAELRSNALSRIQLKGMKGSQPAFVGAALLAKLSGTHIFVLGDKETAAYFHNDLETIFDEREMDYARRRILFLPASCKRPYETDTLDSASVLMRSEVLGKIPDNHDFLAVVTYPEALAEKVTDRITVGRNTLRIACGDRLSLDFMIEYLSETGFERVDFVIEPGQYAVRGGIVDVYSFSNDYPYRIEFFADEVETIRSFDPASQLSVTRLVEVSIMPDLQSKETISEKISFTAYLGRNSTFWFEDLNFTVDRMDIGYRDVAAADKEQHFIDGQHFLENLTTFPMIVFGGQFLPETSIVFEFDALPQPSFNKNFDLLLSNIYENTGKGIDNIIFSVDRKQAERLFTILQDIRIKQRKNDPVSYSTIARTIHEGFVDFGLKLACYSDHQIFDRYHRFHLRDGHKGKEALTLKELYSLQPGDYVTHIDHGVGRFDGLETIDNNGKQQEAIRLVYQDGDLLYVSIHSLHRISKYVGKEGIAPGLNKLGTNNWTRLKERTKKKVKDIAKDLIQLYAERRTAKGFAFSPDSYLQHELEASFIYEDTPDQLKTTVDVKTDLEKDFPMNRLVCGDVGFGKTEVAVRAAFKAVADSKQVAVLVPTTILALQHYKTFNSRLADFPVKVEYINRFKSSKQQKQILGDLLDGRIDIIIGTHRLVANDVKFKDLGLLIIDEEQKFGVAIKEKLKRMKVNVDTLTLTATPIPRTLQFSLLGARDLSVINTPPPNRIPIRTEVRGFSEEFISNAVNYEIARNGQVFFVHNRVQNINDVADLVRKYCPGVKVRVGHGQMEGKELEKVMLDFIEGDFDVLVATTIVENGLDIPNANTIIINDAHTFGLSDLHQLRGRVGRANRQAFCYLLTPPVATLTQEARKRLKALEEFSNLGSGFNIAMRDLDIRGAGNMLGAEQSGFISDIGFEMYNKILDEAMLELREEEFKDLFGEKESQVFVKDCQLETDLELLIPADYISVTTERISIYKELDSIENDEGLQRLEQQLTDRFGPFPEQVVGLFQAVRLRWLAKKIGFEKLVFKNGNLTGYFVGSEDSAYYNSAAFTHVLNFIKNNPRACAMRENKNKLSIKFTNVKSVEQAIEKLQPVVLP